MPPEDFPHPHSRPAALVLCDPQTQTLQVEILANLAAAINKQNELRRLQSPRAATLIPNWPLCLAAAQAHLGLVEKNPHPAR